MATGREPAPETAGRTIHWARFYDAGTWLLTLGRAASIRRATIELAGVAPGEKVLDVGCGTGTLAIDVKANTGPDGEVHGIDASPEMIEVAQRKAAKAGAEVDLRVALIEEIPFPDDTFDLVLSTLMLHHLPDDLKRRGFAEIRRVLKPGGRLVAVDLGSQSHSPIGFLMSLLGHGAPHKDVSKLTGMMEDAGLQDVEVAKTKYRLLAFFRATAGKSGEARP